jgi:hypothetical protein
LDTLAAQDVMAVRVTADAAEQVGAAFVHITRAANT